jgi:hypothetical protein
VAVAHLIFVRRIDTTAIIMRMIYRLTSLAVAILLLIGCTTTEFESWEGRNSVVDGRGGTRKVVDGRDVWTYGDPPRRFQVLGIIQDDRPGGLIPMARLKHDIVDKTRQSGGDAVILVSSTSQLQGYYTAASASAYGYGNYASGFGTSNDRSDYPPRFDLCRYQVSIVTRYA